MQKETNVTSSIYILKKNAFTTLAVVHLQWLIIMSTMLCFKIKRRYSNCDNVANYDTAVTILTYEGAAEFANCYQPVGHESLKSARKPVGSKQLEVLEALQTPAESYQAFLMPMILPRLPRELVVEWKRIRSEERDNVQELLAFLKSEVLIRERHGSLDSSTKSGSEIKKPITEKKIYPGKKYTMAALHASIKQACNLCQQDHQI
ncbi:hypothetical protein T09_9839 [Trichinella sp. T9]|nr:hypothetical protein T09_9839 [Trichinella sp. T9]